MPIIKERGGKLRCKSNGVDTKVDPWKDVELEWLRINPRCDRPSKTDDQVIKFCRISDRLGELQCSST